MLPSGTSCQTHNFPRRLPAPLVQQKVVTLAGRSITASDCGLSGDQPDYAFASSSLGVVCVERYLRLSAKRQCPRTPPPWWWSHPMVLSCFCY